ncbi:MAG: GNAT family N-acetyltransferase [Pirellulales bacterium]
MSVKNADVVDAIEVFVSGFAATRSRTHPYLAERVGKLWWLHDGPRRTAHGHRKDEWVAYDVAPQTVDAAARERSRGRYCVSVIRGVDEPDEALRAEYKGLGYRLMTTEPFFVHPLKRIPKLEAPAEIVRLLTAELAEKFAKETRMKVLTPAQYADDAPQRQYVALDGKKIVGWVCSVAAGDSRWCTNMVVRPSHRRRGIGKALLAKMLREDRSHGARQSVLLASHAGALLYPHVGYEQVGLLLMFVPKRR